MLILSIYIYIYIYLVLRYCGYCAFGQCWFKIQTWWFTGFGYNPLHPLTVSWLVQCWMGLMLFCASRNRNYDKANILKCNKNGDWAKEELHPGGKWSPYQSLLEAEKSHVPQRIGWRSSLAGPRSRLAPGLTKRGQMVGLDLEPPWQHTWEDVATQRISV